jgi:hypothetical protein
MPARNSAPPHELHALLHVVSRRVVHLASSFKRPILARQAASAFE